MKLIIAEKPSVAKEIATLVNAKEPNDGYIKGSNYIVTWAFGHLVSLALPAEYGFNGFIKENLPILPERFKLIIKQDRVGKVFKDNPGAKKQLGIIKKLFDEVDSIIVATDAGREGELIFRYIYYFLGCKKPFERLWINSLTDKAINEGLKKLQPGKNFDRLFYAAQARSEADWLIGINATQALSIAAGNGIYSLGRVQTPTLAMICNRYLENKSFVPTKYWQISLTCEKNIIPFTLLSEQKFNSFEEANLALNTIKEKNITEINSIETKEVRQEPPLLYDLTALQKDANNKYSLSAEETLNIAQSLYEKKLLSYPRTGSRYIPEDVFLEIHSLIGIFRNYDMFSEISKELYNADLNKKSVNAAKVTDHHALIITENIPQNLNNNEKLIYDLVYSRFLEAFSKICIKDITTVKSISANYFFETKGSVTKQMGWRAVRGNEQDDDKTVSLPALNVNEVLNLKNVEVLEKQTKPKPLHTESSLLSAMENAGKELEDTDERNAMKDAGIGTPATRAAIIETLFTRDYIRREKKSLVPTEKGLNVYEVVKSKKISDVQMTGLLESKLLKIEQAEISANSFKSEISDYTKQITNELLSTSIQAEENSNSLLCPKCSKHIKIYDKVAKCSNAECDFLIFREIAGKKISENQIQSLIQKKQTSIIKGFTSKAGKKFDAKLILDDSFKIKFLF